MRHLATAALAAQRAAQAAGDAARFSRRMAIGLTVTGAMLSIGSGLLLIAVAVR